MPHPTARLVVVTLACVAATGCLRTQVEPGPATDTILHLVARPARPVPAGPPASNLHWRGRSETQHTWIVVEADVADGKVTHFRFDTGCIGQDKSLVGWSPHGQVATIDAAGQFELASEGFAVSGTFHGDVYADGDMQESIGFDVSCEGAGTPPLPDRWRVAPERG